MAGIPLPAKKDAPFLLADSVRLEKTKGSLDLQRYEAMLKRIGEMAEAEETELFNPDCIAVDIDKKHMPLAFSLMSFKTRLFAVSVMYLLTGDARYVSLADRALEEFLALPFFYEQRPGGLYGVASPETAAAVRGMSVLLDTFRGAGDPSLYEKTVRRLGALSQRLYEILEENSPAFQKEADRDVACDLACAVGMASMLLTGADPRSGSWFLLSKRYVEDYLASMPADGSNTRGVIRWQYSVGALCLYINALFNFCGLDLRKHEALERCRRFAINLAAPLAKGITVMEDDVKLSVGRQLFGFASKALSVWFADKTIGWGISREKAPGKWAQPEEIFFMDYPAGALPPKGGSVLYKDAGLAVLRSGYDENDMQLSLKSTRSVATPYGDRYCAQNDIQLFLGGCGILLNNGIAWSAQPNFFRRYRSERAHNSIAHAGQGIIPETQGKITDFVTGENADLLRGRAVYSYNGKMLPFYRSIVFIKPDIIVLYDYIKSRMAGSIDWFWHGSGRFYVNSLESLQGFSVVDDRGGKPVTLRVYLFKPEAWSYSIDTGWDLEDWVTGHESTHSVLAVRESYREDHRLLAVMTGNKNAIGFCSHDTERRMLNIKKDNRVYKLDYSGTVLGCTSGET
ncbi:MAG: heparinase II/III family protein [Abditibacteriota bacterium]|nr:heparinase II/III family protein [Abditibacteriota bacterium]